jgi:hypothetical protein
MTEKKKKKDEAAVLTFDSAVYGTKLTFLEDVLGTAPKDPEVYKAFIESKKPQTVTDNETDTLSEFNEEEKGWTGFHQDDKGLFFYDYMIRGYLKHAGNTLKTNKGIGITNLRHHISNLVQVGPRRLHVKSREGYFIKVPDGNLERPLRGQTKQGPRVFVARSDKILAGSSLELEITVLLGLLSEQQLRLLLLYGQFIGLAQWRTARYGSFSYELWKKEKSDYFQMTTTNVYAKK